MGAITKFEPMLRDYEPPITYPKYRILNNSVWKCYLSRGDVQLYGGYKETPTYIDNILLEEVELVLAHLRI